jgi:hypothetical protein
MARRNPQRGATTTTTARAQKPTDSRAASLPTETLAQILASSLEGLDAWERQQARMSFSQVCAGWYSAVNLGRELAVKDTNMAERCARFLAKKSVEERRRICSLSINIEEMGAGRGQRVANVVKACSQVETLELLGIGCRLGTSGHPLGTPLTLTLKSLSKIRTSRSCLRGNDDMSVANSWGASVSLGA